MVVQIDVEEQETAVSAPYVSAGRRSLRAEPRTAPPPGSQARWSALPEEDRDGRPWMLRWLKDTEIVEETVELAFLEAVRRRPKRPPMPLAWITTVAYRRAITLAQHRASEDPEEFAVPELVEERLGHGHATEPALWLEATELLRSVAELPLRQRRVIELAGARFTYRETGQRIGGTVRGIESTARRARGTLPAQLDA